MHRPSTTEVSWSDYGSLSPVFPWHFVTDRGVQFHGPSYIGFVIGRGCRERELCPQTTRFRESPQHNLIRLEFRLAHASKCPTDPIGLALFLQQEVPGPLQRTIAKRKGPIGEVQRMFEAVTKLPRKQQRKVLEMVQALVEQYKRKAS
jgi:hypothetical protein